MDGGMKRTVLVSTTVKFKGSVSTRFHASVLVPVDDHPVELLGVVTEMAAAESARARTERTACIVDFEVFLLDCV